MPCILLGPWVRHTLFWRVSTNTQAHASTRTRTCMLVPLARRAAHLQDPCETSMRTHHVPVLFTLLFVQAAPFVHHSVVARCRCVLAALDAAHRYPHVVQVFHHGANVRLFGVVRVAAIDLRAPERKTLHTHRGHRTSDAAALNVKRQTQACSERRNALRCWRDIPLSTSFPHASRLEQFAP